MEQKLREHVSTVSKLWLNELTRKDNHSWNELEESLAYIHLLLIQPLLFDNVPFLATCPIDHKTLADICNNAPRVAQLEKITLGAVNWRGLYLQNGRQTLLAPTGLLKQEYPDLEWHSKLHHEYLHFAGKHLSINQLFLEWKIANGETDQQTLSIGFGAANSHIRLKDTDDVQIMISKELTNKLFQKDITSLIVNSHKVINGPCPDFDHFEKLQKKCVHAVEDCTKYILRNEIKFFDEFYQIFIPTLSTMEALNRFQEGLTSLYWLSLYCNEDFAGQNFLTTRLPRIFIDSQGYPDSSISIVSNEESNLVKDVICTLVDIIRGNSEYESLKEFIKEQFNYWIRRRTAEPDSEDPEYHLWNLIQAVERDVKDANITINSPPLDFGKLRSVCRLTQFLSGTRHEGQLLRFVMLLGFTHEQIMGQLEGAVEEYGTKLGWPDLRMRQPTERAVANWIKANSLLLQRWDRGLFFESDDDLMECALPRRILRIRRLESKDCPCKNPQWRGFPNNEFELRRSLTQITHDLRGTAAVVISERGATLIIRGKSYIFHYHDLGGKYQVFVASLRGNKSFAEAFEDALIEQLRKLAGKGKGGIWEKRANQLRNLVEAIALMGYGALIAIRIIDSDKERRKSKLPPLAPVWKLCETQTVDDLSNDIMTFALAAALDGATEIVFTNSSNEESEVIFRRYVDVSFTPWKETKDTIYPKNDYKPEKIGWDELMTFGMRHRSAIGLSRRDRLLVITVSADGPVRLWSNGDKLFEIKFKP